MHPKKLKKGDKVAIVSLSDGVLGESFVEHELVLLEKRLTQDFGLTFEYMRNSRKGIEYLKKNPQARAEDLKQAFLDPQVKIVWTALGGDDTFLTLPYLMNDEFRKIVKENPKIFLGMSDTTNNHLMFYSMGLSTLYGPALLSDVAELGPEIFHFTKGWINQLFDNQKNIIVKSAAEWYESRKSFGPDQLGIPRFEHKEKYGHEYLYGEGVVEGELLGGCLDSLYESLVSTRYKEQAPIFKKYPIFPKKEVWRGKIVFLETSEERPNPEKYATMLSSLEDQGVFDVASGLIVGKPQDETYYNEYKSILTNLAHKHKLPIVYNVNFGHTTPRIILPYGSPLKIDFDKKVISLPEGLNLG